MFYFIPFNSIVSINQLGLCWWPHTCTWFPQLKFQRDWQISFNQIELNPTKRIFLSLSGCPFVVLTILEYLKLVVVTYICPRVKEILTYISCERINVKIHITTWLCNSDPFITKKGGFFSVNPVIYDFSNKSERDLAALNIPQSIQYTA